MESGGQHAPWRRGDRPMVNDCMAGSHPKFAVQEVRQHDGRSAVRVDDFGRLYALEAAL